MCRLLIGCLMFASAASFADVPQGVTRASPATSFSTHKTAEAFAQCVLDASRSEFPASRVEATKAGKVISVIQTPSADAVALIDIEELGGKGVVVVRSTSRAQPQRDPIVKLARNCQ